jgi:hypothetical protein
MSAQKIKEGLGQVGQGLKEAAGTGVEKTIEGLLEFRRGRPSLLRLVTIPLGALAVGVAFAAAGMVEEFGSLREDFKRAREEEAAAAAAAAAGSEPGSDTGSQAADDVAPAGAASEGAVVQAATPDGGPAADGTTRQGGVEGTTL